jgi:hypothetical protein
MFLIGLLSWNGLGGAAVERAGDSPSGSIGAVLTVDAGLGVREHLEACGENRVAAPKAATVPSGFEPGDRGG